MTNSVGFPAASIGGAGGGGGGTPLKGTISVNTDFPLIADVADGDIYRVLADVTDNAGVLYTNTGQSFVAGGEIIWNGTDWTELGPLLDADQVSYDNAASGLAATDVQAAIDELDADVESHSANHEVGGGDEIKLDDLAAPDDNTDLNASITAHGLLVKLPNSESMVLDGVGAWVTNGPVETVTPAANVALGLTTAKIKELAIAHDVAFTLAGTVASKSTTIAVYIENGSGGDLNMTFPVAWGWTSFEPSGIKDGDKGWLVVTAIGTKVIAAYGLTEVATNAPKMTYITVADTPYSPSPQEIIVVDTTGGDVTIRLPDSADWPQATGCIVKRLKADVSANNIILDADTVASQLIEGVTTFSFNGLGQSQTVVPSVVPGWILT